jgi:4-diphosphocytidyl-2-C-methyl-D-erythritol kinase
VHVSTALAYSMVTPKPASFDLQQVHNLPRSEWQKIVTNDFEKPMIEKYPVIGEIKNSLIENGAFYASMSGSGSAVFGLFEKEINLAHVWPEYFYRNAIIL